MGSGEFFLLIDAILMAIDVYVDCICVPFFLCAYAFLIFYDNTFLI